MDIKWTYGLIVAIYIVLLLIKGINVILIKRFKENKDLVIVKGFKKDFFTSIAQICIGVTIIINGMTIVGGRPLNINSMIITLLIVGMALLSGTVTILLEKECALNISAYEFEAKDIKQIEIKKKTRYTLFDIELEDDVNGYDNIKFYVMSQNREVFEKELNQLTKKA